MFDVNDIDNMLKKVTIDNKLNKITDDMYLSNRQIEVLDRYNIDYKKYSHIRDLIFEIETIISENYDLEDLENLSIELSEFNYYYNTRK